MGDSKHVKANIQALADELALMPAVGDEERVISTREAVRLLQPTIRKMQRKGYRIERIVERLAASGVTVTPATLRGYLRGGKKSKATAAVRETGGRRATPAAAAAAGGAAPNAAAANGAPTRGDSRAPASAPAAPCGASTRA